MAATIVAESTRQIEAATQKPRPTLKLALPGLLLALVCLVPFLNKAYTIDDPLFLYEANQILKTPLHPWSFPLCWMSNEVCYAEEGNQGPLARQGLMGYALAPVMMAGGSEVLAHVLQLALVLVIVIEMVRLALQLGFPREQAAFAGVLVVAIPPLLSMASTAMPDVLAFALGLTGLERLLAWKKERRWHQAVTASVALALAPYARPHFATFLFLGALWLFDEFQIRSFVAQFRRDARLWAPLLAAGALLLAVNILTRQQGAQMGFGELYIGIESILVNLTAYLHYLSFPLPLGVVWLATHWRKARTLVVFPLVPTILAYFVVSPRISLTHELELGAVLFGFAVILDIVWTDLRGTDRLERLLCVWMLLPLSTVIYLHLPIKYMLAAMPAIVLRLIRLLAAALSQTRALAACTTIAVLCGGYSLMLLRADLDFAEYGRRAAAELIAPRVAAGEKVWFGGQWGFHWYAEKAGAEISQPDRSGPKPGDLLAVGLMEGGEFTLERFPNRELVDWRSYDSPHGRTFGYGAGLYSNRFGLLPWRWNPGATNVYQVWRVR